EYVQAEQIRQWWDGTRAALLGHVAGGKTTVEQFLHASSPLWSLGGGGHVHLAKNRRDPDRPFAFLATYTQGVSETGKVRHAPLGQALREYAGARTRRALLSG